MIRPNYSVLDIADSVRPNLGSAKNMEKDSAEPNSSAESEGSVRSVHHYRTVYKVGTITKKVLEFDICRRSQYY